MWDAHIAELAGRQHNRIARRQLLELGLSQDAIAHRVAAGRLVILDEAVLAVAPVIDDEKGRWMGATLTAPLTFLSHVSAAAADGWWSLPRDYETVTRPGSGGPRRFGSLLVHRSDSVERFIATRSAIPVTTTARTILDLAPHLSEKAVRRSVREAVRLGRTSIAELVDVVAAHPGRRGTRRLLLVASDYAGLPLAKARSGAEVRALQLLRAEHRPMPRLNHRIAGEEADLSWPAHRLIIEIDGGPFHLDRGEDARKEAVWRAAGWTVLRGSSDAVYEEPDRLLALAPLTERP